MRIASIAFKYLLEILKTIYKKQIIGAGTFAKSDFESMGPSTSEVIYSRLC